jgi:Porin subfamily
MKVLLVVPAIALLYSAAHLPAAAAPATAARAAQASPSPRPRSEVEQLRAVVRALQAQVKQLETQQAAQAALAKSLQGEINVAKAQQQALGSNNFTSGSSAGSSALPAANIDRSLQERVEQLETLQASEAAVAKTQEDEIAVAKAQEKAIIANAVTGGSFPGSFLLPGTSTSIGIHGFLDLQTFYDPNQYLGDKFQVGQILPNGFGQEQTAGTVHFQGKLTRLSVETQTPTSLGNLRTFFGTDFYGYEAGGSAGPQAIQNSNYSLRLREAFGQLDGFLIGKTWSNFEDDPDSMDSLDNSGPAGVPSELVMQLRYTHPIGLGKFSFSIENPATDYAGSDSPTDIEQASPYNPVPDFTGRYSLGGRWGHVQLSGVLRDLAYDDGKGHRSAASAGGGIAGLTINLGGPATSIGGQTWFGNGIEKFTPDDFGPVSSAQIDNIGTAQQRLYGSNEHGFTVFTSHVFSSAVRANLGYGFNFMNWYSFIPASATEPVDTHTIHANVIWSPVKQTDFGLEYIHGMKTFRDSLNLPATAASRLEGAFKYMF